MNLIPIESQIELLRNLANNSQIYMEEQRPKNKQGTSEEE